MRPGVSCFLLDERDEGSRCAGSVVAGLGAATSSSSSLECLRFLSSGGGDVISLWREGRSAAGVRRGQKTWS